MGSTILEVVFTLADIITDSLWNLFSVLSLPLSDFIQRILPIPDAILGFLGNLGDIPTFGFIFGGGIVLILVYNFVSWIIDVLP